MRGAAVRPPRRHCWAVVFLAALRAAHLQPRRRRASSAPSPPFLLQSLSVHQRLQPGEVAFHTSSLDRRSTRLRARIYRLPRIPGAKRVVHEYVVGGPTLKNKTGSVPGGAGQAAPGRPTARSHNQRQPGAAQVPRGRSLAGRAASPGAILSIASAAGRSS